MNHNDPKSYRAEGSTPAASLIAEGGVLSVKKTIYHDYIQS